MNYRGFFSTKAILATALLLLNGCSPAYVNLDLEDPSWDMKQIPLDVTVDLPSSLCTYMVRYEDDYDLTVFMGDALKAYVERVGSTVFTKKVNCPGGDSTFFPAKAKLLPALVYVTKNKTGFGGWSEQLTEVIFRWTLFDERDFPIWSQEYRGSCRGKNVTGFTSKKYTAQRTEKAIQELYEKAVTSMLESPAIWQYAKCAPLYSAGEDDLPGMAERVLDNAVECNDEEDALLYMLLFASQHGRYSIVEWLIEKGADVNCALEYSSVTPLGMALSSGHLEVAKLLVDNGADYNFRDDNGHSLYYHAARNGNSEAVDFLADLGVDIHPVSWGGHGNMATAICYQASADRLPESSLKEEYYGSAAEHFRLAANQFEELSARCSDRVGSLKTVSFLKTLGKLFLVAWIQAESEEAARIQDKQLAQCMAMKNAKDSGTGINGYIQYMNNWEEKGRWTQNRYFYDYTSAGFSILTLYDPDDVREIDLMKTYEEQYGLLARLCLKSAEDIENRDGSFDIDAEDE